jgi:hypothetical protein
MTLTADNELKLEGLESREGLSDVGEKAKEMARRRGEEVREGLGEARDAAAERADATIDRAAEEVSDTARALGEAARSMQDGGMSQGLLREASHGLERLSGAMRGRSASELIADLSDFGRRNPAAFLGAAAVAGFALARFGVASERSSVEPGEGGYHG